MAEVITWPEFLGIPASSGYDYAPEDRRVETEMEIGSRQRICHDTDETTINCDLFLERGDLAFFEAFEKHVLRQGSVWFEMPLMTAGKMENHVVRFKERPKIGSFFGGTVTVSMVLDVQKRLTLSASEVWLRYEQAIGTLIDDGKIVWPESLLGTPQWDGYEYSPTDQRAKSDMDISGKYNALFDTDETILNCNFILNVEQIAFFEAFEKHILRQGSRWFEMPLLVAGNITAHKVRFKERPSIEDVRGNYATVNMTLEVAERKTLDEETIWMLYLFGGLENFLWFEDVLQKSVNERYPKILPFS